MARYRSLSAATALAGGAFFVMSFLPSSPQQFDDPLARLLDPTQTARLACRGNSKPTLAAAFYASAAYAALSTEADGADRPPLYKGLGSDHFPISTDNTQAQAYFDQGLKFSFAFNHYEAARAFREAQHQDPACAMCYWGEALVLGPNINAPMDISAHAPTRAALAMAKNLAPQASKLEQALISALDHRYSDIFLPDRAAYDSAYADAMIEVARRFPDNNSVQILAAEASMDAQPWAYWESDGQIPVGRADIAISMIETVLTRAPDNAGAIHLYIHLMEASATPEHAEAYADRLAALMPAAGHIVHMPSHLYYRIGRYRDSINTNIKAIAADEAFFQTAGRDGIYGYGYYPHNIHFTLASALIAGNSDISTQMAEKLSDLIPLEAALAAPAFVQPIVAAPFFAYAQFPDRRTADTIPTPDARMPFVLAIWHYARGMHYIASHDKAALDREMGALTALMETTDFTDMENGGVPALTILEIAMHVLKGREAMAGQAYEAAILHFKTAANLQDSLPYMEPPYWYYPVRQSLGAAQLLAGSADEAVSTLRQSLYDNPNNAYALYALAQAEKARGQAEAAKAARKAYKAVWMGKDAPDLKQM